MANYRANVPQNLGGSVIACPAAVLAFVMSRHLNGGHVAQAVAGVPEPLLVA